MAPVPARPAINPPTAARAWRVELMSVSSSMVWRNPLTWPLGDASALANTLTIRSVAMLANHMGARGEEIPAGAVVLSGGITEALAVQAGDAVTLKVQGMGTTGVRFV